MKSSKHAVLLLHGLAGSPAEMVYIKLVLERSGYHVEVPLLPGHGTHYSDLKNIPWTTFTREARKHFQDLHSRFEKVSVGGLCMGAVLSLDIAAEFGDQVHSVCPISTTLFFDGWGLPSGSRLIPILRYTPVYYFYNLSEGHPFGVKDARTREWIRSHMTVDSTTHYSKIPFRAVWQMHLLCQNTKQRLKKITSPVFAIHPVEDDVSSLQSVEAIKKEVAPHLFSSLLLHDSYHLATIDRERNLVAKSIVAFIGSIVGVPVGAPVFKGNVG